MPPMSGIPFRVPGRPRLQNNANQAVAAVVNNFLYGIPYLSPCVGRHTVELIVQALVYKLVNRLAEDIALPDFFGTFLKLFEKIRHKLLGLLLRADNRRDLGLGFNSHHMD